MTAQGALRGVNARSVGLLLVALYHRVWTSSISGAAGFALAIARNASVETHCGSHPIKAAVPTAIASARRRAKRWIRRSFP